MKGRGEGIPALPSRYLLKGKGRNHSDLEKPEAQLRQDHGDANGQLNF